MHVYNKLCVLNINLYLSIYLSICMSVYRLMRASLYRRRRAMRPMIIKVHRAKDLPIADWDNGLADPYVAITVLRVRTTSREKYYYHYYYYWSCHHHHCLSLP